MLDWLTTKIAVGIGAIIMLTSVIGFYKIQMDQTQQQEAAEIVRAVAERIERVASIIGETQQGVTFDETLKDRYVYLKPTIGNARYDLEFRCDNVSYNISTKIIKPYYMVGIKINGVSNVPPPKFIKDDIHIWWDQSIKDEYSFEEFNSIDEDMIKVSKKANQVVRDISSGDTKNFFIIRAEISISGNEQYHTFILSQPYMQ